MHISKLMCAWWNERNQTNQYRTIETIISKGNFGIGNTRIGNKVLVGGEIIKPDLGWGQSFSAEPTKGPRVKRGVPLPSEKATVMGDSDVDDATNLTQENQVKS